MAAQKEADADAAMSAAERILKHLNSFADSAARTELLAVASFFLRLAAALLLEKDCPAGGPRYPHCPRSRIAGQDLSRRLLEEQSSFMRRKALHLPPEPRRPGRPLTDHDRRLGAETARTLQDLRAVRADLFCEYLFLGSHLPPPDELPEPTTGALALLHKYWQDRRRLLLIREPRRKAEPEPTPAKPDFVAESVSDLSHDL